MIVFDEVISYKGFSALGHQNIQTCKIFICSFILITGESVKVFIQEN